MNIKRVSILGCGWLGLPLAVHLKSREIRVKGSTTTSEKLSLLQECGIVPFLLDLRIENAEVYYDFLLNSEVLIINIPPGRVGNILETYKERIQTILSYISVDQKVIFISSTSVYQNTNSEALESQDPIPEKMAGKAILIVENLLRKSLGDRLTIIRFSGLVGYDRLPGRFLANKKGLKNGNAPVNIIHRDDCIGLIEAVIEKEVWGEILNGCADKHPLRKQYYTLAAKKIGLTPPEFVDEEGANYKIVSNTKSKKIVGYTYVYSDPLELLNLT